MGGNIPISNYWSKRGKIEEQTFKEEFSSGRPSLAKALTKTEERELAETFSIKKVKKSDGKTIYAPIDDGKSPYKAEKGKTNDRVLTSYYNDCEAELKQIRKDNQAKGVANNDERDKGIAADRAIKKHQAAAEKKAQEQDKKARQIMEKTNCSYYEALKKQGVSEDVARRRNSVEKANNPSYDPPSSLSGFGYRQILRYLQAAKQDGFVLVKQPDDTYVRYTREQLEKAAKEIEEREHLDRKEFYKSAACDRCHYNHHGSLKNGKETT